MTVDDNEQMRRPIHAILEGLCRERCGAANGESEAMKPSDILSMDTRVVVKNRIDAMKPFPAFTPDAFTGIFIDMSNHLQHSGMLSENPPSTDSCGLVEFIHKLKKRREAMIRSIVQFWVVLTLIVIPCTHLLHAQWVQTGGPPGAFIEDFTHTSAGLFAATRDGVYFSADNGYSWVRRNNGLTDLHVQSVTSLAGNVFAGTYNNGVFVSTDNGLSWSQRNNGLSGGSVVSIKTVGTTIVCWASSKVWRSTDAGMNWSSSSSPPASSLVRFKVIGSTIYALTWNTGLYRSTNEGLTWIQMGLAGLRVSDVASSGSIFVAGTDAGLQYSNDGGSTWNTTGVTSYGDMSLLHIGTKFVCAVNSLSIYTSSNGSSWTFASGCPVVITALYFHNSVLLAGGYYDGVALSQDEGATWPREAVGFLSGTASSLSGNDSYLYAGIVNTSGVYRSSNSGASWEQVGITNNNVRTIASTGNTVYAGVHNGLYYSTDNGNGWNQIPGFTKWVDAILVDGTTLFVGGNNGMFRSTDNGNTFSEISTGLPSNTFMNSITKVGTYLFLGLSKTGGIYVSTNNGNQWQERNAGLEQEWIYDLLAIGNTLLAATSSGAFRSTNFGASWTKISIPSSQMVRCFGRHDGYVFAGTRNGVILSSDEGLTWQDVSANLAVASCTKLFLTTTTFYAGIDGRGVWRRPISEMTTTALIAPTLFSPADGSTGVSQSPTLRWNESQGATSYDCQTSTNAGFTANVIDYGNLTGLSLAISGLSPLTTYHWRVRAKNSSMTSSWSEAWEFTTEIASPEVPSLLDPVNGAQNASTNTVLSWSPSARATSYRLQVSANPIFSSPIIDQSGISQTSYTCTGLLAGTTYYWRVSANNQSGSSDWSAYWLFTTGTAIPVIPTLLSPADGTVNAAVNTIVSWNASSGASTYRLQVSSDPSFATTSIDQTNINQTSFQLSNLTGGILYYWRVQARNTAGSSGWSNAWRFTTVASVGIRLIVPNGGEIWDIGSMQQIRWTSSGIANLKIIYSSDSGVSWNVVVESTAAAPQQYTWTIPNSRSTACIVRVMNALDPTVFDESDAVFTIKQTGDPKCELSTHFLSFGNTGIGQTNAKTVTLRNTGTADLTILSSSITGRDATSFSAQVNTQKISPTGSAVITISFEPKSSEGLKEATFFISTDDPQLALDSINLVGNAVLSSISNEVCPPAGNSIKNIYPNPAKNLIDIVYDITATGEIELTVNDVLGRQVQRIQTSHNRVGVYRIPLEVGHLVPGTYLVSLTSKHNRSVQLLHVLR